MNFDVGLATRTSDGSILGGDVVAIHHGSTSLGVVVVDIAGNGWTASRTAWKMRGEIDRAAQLTPAEGLGSLHERMRGCRGAVAGALQLESGGRVCSAAVGDVRMVRWRAGTTSSMPVASGQLGHACPTLVEHTSNAVVGDLYIVVTDGVRSSIDLLPEFTPVNFGANELAARILERGLKPHEDATCVVVRAEW